jgi:preprotein translocase subunit SecF
LEIVPPGTNFDFIGKRSLAALLSVGLILAGLVAIPLKGINWGIDFAGGTEIQVKFAPGVAASDGQIRELVTGAAEIEDPSVVRYGEEAENEFLIKFRGALEAPGSEPAEGEEASAAEGEQTADRITRIERSLAGGIGSVIIERVDFVGPRVGAELRDDGMFALFWASVAILVYITFRFSSRFAPGAVVAVIHDLLITAGVFVILGLEFDLRILAAMLAILGYSLNDTIIIYDRIRENMEKRSKADLPVVLNQSVNQTLSRTVLTSGTTLAALLALFFLGGEVIRPFAFAMILGVIVGTYSSVFIAAPVLLLLERART